MITDKIKLFSALYFPSAIWITLLALLGHQAIGTFVTYGPGIIALGLISFIPGFIAGFITSHNRFKSPYVALSLFFPLLSFVTVIFLSTPTKSILGQLPILYESRVAETIDIAPGKYLSFIAHGKGKESWLRLSDLQIQLNSKYRTILKVKLTHLPKVKNHFSKVSNSTDSLLEFFEESLSDKDARIKAVKLIQDKIKGYRSAKSLSDLKYNSITSQPPTIATRLIDDNLVLLICAVWHIFTICLIVSMIVIRSFLNREFKPIEDLIEPVNVRVIKEWELPGSDLSLGEARCPKCKSKFNYLNNEGMIISIKPTQKPTCSRCGTELNIPLR